MPKVKRPRLESKDADVTIRLNVEERKEAASFIAYNAMGNILCDFSVKEFMRAKTSLMITQTMETHWEELRASIEHEEVHTSLLQGPSGIGKTTTMLFIGHMARTNGYVVFPIQARDFVNQPDPMTMLIRQFLCNWRDAEGETKLKQIIPCLYVQYATLWDLLNQNFGNDKLVVDTFRQVVEELRLCTTKPVVFLIDQCNVFYENPQTIKLYANRKKKVVSPDENPVGARFLDWNTFKVKRGGIFFSFSSAFQLMQTARDGNASLFSRMEPMDHENFKVFVDFLVGQNVLPRKCDFDDLFELCGGIPREAREFGSEKKRLFGDRQSHYQQWKDAYMKARIPFFKTRIQRLLDKKKTWSRAFETKCIFCCTSICR